jgi:enoyl-CoA hydratase/carnithine racemase
VAGAKIRDRGEEAAVSSVKVERQGRLAVLRMDKARGNAIDEPFAEDMLAACRTAAEDGNVHGVLLASAHPKLFCPGLDLPTLFQYDRPSMSRFMEKFGDAVIALFSMRKPVVAAIAGHAVAGGCVLALTADHRILRRGSQIGLNEVRVGLPLPWSVALLLKSAVPPGALSRVALLGENFADEEARAIGLVHEVRDAEGFEAACVARAQEFAEKDVAAVGTTKAYLRDAALREMQSREKELQGEFLDAWFSPSGREKIRQTVEALTKKAS